MKRLLALLLFAGPAFAQPSQFTFAWPLHESALKPRGATTQGVPVELDTAPSREWRRLRAAATAHERDRAAILAMAGEYRVSFDFLEVVRYDPARKPDAPYQSWGTEIVLVSEDGPERIALQHILVMRVRRPDGSASEPIVVRHWRQEWRYEPERLLAYAGNENWVVRKTADEDRRGAWVQSVFQVDDSPRYAASGRWEHTDSFSTWIGAETWRPLPRREFSVRDDYQVLAGTNRHTILPAGWVQEENNLKLAVDAAGRPRAGLPFVAREYGIARYERIRGYDFGPGRRYFERTEPFWAEVRAAWRSLADRQERLALKARVDQHQLFVPFFDYAAKLDGGVPWRPEEGRAFIEKTLREAYLR